MPNNPLLESFHVRNIVWHVLKEHAPGDAPLLGLDLPAHELVPILLVSHHLLEVVPHVVSAVVPEGELEASIRVVLPSDVDALCLTEVSYVAERFLGAVHAARLEHALELIRPGSVLHRGDLLSTGGASILESERSQVDVLEVAHEAQLLHEPKRHRDH